MSSDSRQSLSAEDLTCPICFTDYDLEIHLPKVLPCLHTFCEDCLQTLALSHDENVICPLCRTLAHRNDAVNTKIVATLVQAVQLDEEGPALSHNVIEDELLEDEETASRPEQCPLCSYNYDDMTRKPRILECSHIFCENCLSVFLSSSPGGWVKFIYCPICNGQSAVFSSSNPLIPPSVWLPAAVQCGASEPPQFIFSSAEPCWYMEGRMHNARDLEVELDETIGNNEISEPTLNSRCCDVPQFCALL